MKKISTLACFLALSVFVPTVVAQRTAEDHYKTSYSLLRNRDLDGALAALDKAIALKPDYAQAYAQRARLRTMKGQIDTALVDFDKALQIDSEMTEVYVSRARIRMMRSDMRGALSDLDNAIVRGHRSDDVYSSRAQLRMMTQDIQGAISDLNTAVSMNPNRIGHYLARGAARERSGDHDGAIIDYKYIIDKFEEEERARLAAGKPARQATDFDIKSPVISGPETSSPGKNGKETGKTEGMAAIMVNTGPGMTPEKMEYLPNVAGAYLNRAAIYRKRGDSEAAMTDLNKSIAIDPHFFAAYYDRGRELQKRGDLGAAFADFSKVIERQPRLAAAYVERGSTLLLMGKDAEAEKDFAQGLALDARMATMIENRRTEAKNQREKKPQ